MDGSTAIAVETSTGNFTAAQARAHMLANVNKIAPIPRYDRDQKAYTIRRQTLNEKRMGGFWVMYKWGLDNFELHVHYNDKGKIKDGDTIKVAGSNMRGGFVGVSTHELNLIRQKINSPAA